MNGIVSLLAAEQYRIVEALWSELESRYGVRGVYVTPYPHFSYQVAEAYDIDRLAVILARFAAAHRPLSVRTSGLAVFTGQKPVLYIPVVRDASLSAFQLELWNASAGAASGLERYYEPERWVPHITIGFGDMNADIIGTVVRELSGRSFDWEFRVDHVAFIRATDGTHALESRFNLGAA